MDARVNIGRTVARERRRRGVTQEELAAHLGVSKAAVSKWELCQSLPDVSLLPRIAAYFSLTLDELFDWRDELTEEESAALYAEVYAQGERDLAAAHERLRALAAEHCSDASLLLILASLLTMWATGMATPSAQAGERDGASDALPDAAALAGEALALLDRVLEVATDPATLFLTHQQKATTLFQAGRHEEAAALLEPLVRRQDAGAPTMLLASAYRRPTVATTRSTSCRRSACARRASCSRRSCRRWACGATRRSRGLPATLPRRSTRRWTWGR